MSDAVSHRKDVSEHLLTSSSGSGGGDSSSTSYRIKSLASGFAAALRNGRSRKIGSFVLAVLVVIGFIGYGTGTRHGVTTSTTTTTRLESEFGLEDVESGSQRTSQDELGSDTCPYTDAREVVGPVTVYLIMVHTVERLEGARELVEQLYDPQDWFVIHADRQIDRASLDMYVAAMTICDNVEFVAERDRIRGQWGGWSLVEIELLLLRHALALDVEWDHAVLLDGSSWPIGTRHFRQAWFERYSWIVSRGGFRSPPRTIEQAGNQDRTPARCLDKACTAMSHTPGNAIVYKRQQWFILNRDTVENMLQGPELDEWIEFFQTTQTPDEHFFVTLQYALPGGPKGWLPETTYVSWSECHNPQRYPETPCHQGMKDLDKIAGEGEPRIFVRKVAIDEVELKSALVHGEVPWVRLPLSLPPRVPVVDKDEGENEV